MGILVCSVSKLCLPQILYRNTPDRSFSSGFQIGEQPWLGGIFSNFQVPLLKNARSIWECRLPPCGSVLTAVWAGWARGAKMRPRVPLHQFLWTVREGQKETWFWLTDINLQMPKEKRFPRLYSVDACTCTLRHVPLSSSLWIHWLASYRSDNAKRPRPLNLLMSAITERRKQWPFGRKGCSPSHTHVSSPYLQNNTHGKKIVAALQ